MRKLIGCGILALSALVVSASSAWADAIPVGELTVIYDDSCTDEEGCPVAFYLSVVNQTGDNAQPGVFPVLDKVDFSTLILTLDGNPVLLTDVFAGDPALEGYAFDGPVGGGSLAFIGGLAPAGPFTVQGGGGFVGGEYLFSGNFYIDPNNVDVSTLDESTIIYIDGRRIDVPEPISLGLLGTGLVGLYLRRRSAKRA